MPVFLESNEGFMKGSDGQVSQAGKAEEILGTALNRVRATLSETKLSEELRTRFEVPWTATVFTATYSAFPPI